MKLCYQNHKVVKVVNDPLSTVKVFILCLCFVIAEDGWYSAANTGHCLQYQKTETAQSWDASRTLCQQKGADLAHIGIRDPNAWR